MAIRQPRTNKLRQPKVNVKRKVPAVGVEEESKPCMPGFLAAAEAEFPYSQVHRRDFHRHPELGYQEIRTSEIVARELQSIDLKVKTGLAETGVVGLLDSGRPGPILMFRFDMDALPIQEETGVEYASLNPGVMHACGHDGHIAVGLTVARLLQRHRQELKGQVKFVFQPAEEGLGGAERMMEAGILTDPAPDFALGMHLWNEQPYGWVGITPGPIMAAGEFFRIEVIGRSGHGALPHQAIDPVLAAAHIVTALQSIPSRNVSPLEAAVVSVTTIHGGEATNVIPTRVQIQGTIRTFDAKVRKLVLQRFADLARGVGNAFGCQIEYEILYPTPAVFNNPDVTDRVFRVVNEHLPDLEISRNHRLMVSEDMAYFLERVPGAFILVGSANPEKNLDAPHHHPRFDFDERALSIGAAILAETAVQILNS